MFRGERRGELLETLDAVELLANRQIAISGATESSHYT
jgi:hypothetical protein